MTRKEIVDLLKIVFAAYPHTKIADPNTMVSTWEMMFGEYSAETIYKAARLHMENSHFFPTVADIKDSIRRAELLYADNKLLEAPKQKKRPVLETPEGMTDEEHILAIIEDQIRLECDLDGTEFTEDLLKDFLPYEK